MVNKILTAAEYDRQIGNLEEEEVRAQDALTSTSGFFSKTAEPSQADLVKEVQLKSVQTQLEKLRSGKLAQDWYGGDGDEMITQEPREGFLLKGLSAISQPLYAQVGAVQYALGKGEPGKGFFESVDASRKARDTYGTLLKKVGVPAPIAFPMGLAADIIFDPVVMLSLGSAGFAGRVGYGAVSGAKAAGAAGAVTGATLGAKASTLGGAKFVTGGMGSILDVLPRLVVGGKKREAAIAAAKAMEKGGLRMDSPEVVNAVAKIINPGATWAGRVQQAAYKASQAIEKVKTGTRTSAVKALDDWRELTGETVERMLEKRAARLSLGDYTRSLIEKLPGGEKILAKVDMNLTKWQGDAMMQDLFLNTLRENKKLLEPAWNPETRSYNFAKLSDEVVDKILAAIKRRSRDLPDEIKAILDNDISAIKRNVEKMTDEGIEIAKQGKNITRGANTVENTNRMLGETIIEENYQNSLAAIKEAMKELSKEKTGIDMIDKAFEKINVFKVKNVEVGKKTMEAYGKFIGLFKSSKLGPLSPASMLYATVGNVTMAHMYGFNLLRPELYKNVKNALGYLRGKTENEIGTILRTNPEIRHFAGVFKTTFAREFGFSYETAMARGALKDAMQKGIQDGIFLPGSAEARLAEQAMIRELDTAFQKGKLSKAAFKETTPSEYQAGKEVSMAELEYKFGVSRRTGEEVAEDIAQEKALQVMAGTRETVAPLAHELAIKPFLAMKENLAVKAAAGDKIENKAAGLLLWGINQSRKYELIDQSWRLGSFIHLVNDGVTEKELFHMTGTLGLGAKILPTDITSRYLKNGTELFRIKPSRAALMVNEVYMNYAAMPAVVKALRQLPIMGYPFFAFAYAMALKTGETALVNPAAFNKVNFFLREFERDKTPLEKQALKGKYYSWYNDPSMVGLPNWLGATKLFSDNPIYMNVASAIPYYSMNMFMPSERKFNVGWRGQLAAAIDNVPLLKDPLGQLITDYFILPNIIRDVQPQNMWGGPLYPESAPIYKKYLAYPLRQLAEAVVPSVAAIPSLAVPDAAIPFIPSYPGRKAAFAVRGKTPVGVKGAEPTTSRGLRAGLSLVGVNLYPANLSFLTSQVKKSMKK